MYRQRDHVDESSLDLGKYIGGSDEEPKEDKIINPRNLHSEQFRIQINRINMRLQQICPERLGDLTSTSTKEIEKTIQLIETLISEIKKMQEIKNKWVSQRRQLEQTLTQNQNNFEKITKEKKNIENEKQNILQKLKVLEKTYKETVEKNQLEKQQLNKQIKQLQLREKSFEAEFRKKQIQIKGLQDGIKKFQDKNPYKNSFDLIQKFQYGPNIYDLYSTNGENQYGRLAKDAKDEVFRRISQENQYLKQCLSNIYKELNSVLQLKKQTLKNKKGYDGQYENFFQLNSFRPQTLLLPEQWSRQRLKQLSQNIEKFKQAIKVGEYSQSRVDEKKQNCVNGIKRIFKDYKQVVQTQDQLLNKVLLKSKQFKATELTHLQNRFSKALDNDQIKRARTFIQEHAHYLEVRNQELEKTKKMMHAAMKKAEQSKKQILKQRQTFQQEAMELRRSVQVLPAIIEQQIGKSLN